MRAIVLNNFVTAQVGISLAIGGCTADLDKARRLQPVGATFAAELAREYRDFALSEADDMYDWPDAFHFAVKALAAGRGEAPVPERPADWSLDQAQKGPAVAAHARLTEALATDARQRLPVIAARAQARFDCWLEQQEEGWQTAHIAGCRDAFETAMATLEADRTVGLGADDNRALASVSGRIETNAFVLFFPFDGSEPDKDGDETVDAIVEAAARHAVTVIVDGHADRAGADPYNRRLSERRADAVRDALVARGIDPGRIEVNAFGESRPRVATPDGLRDGRNRRVEVIVTGRPPL